MKKKRVRILDENMNVESTFFVDIPTNIREREQQLREREIKDFLYSIRFLRSFAIRCLDWSGRNARKNIR